MFIQKKLMNKIFRSNILYYFFNKVCFSVGAGLICGKEGPLVSFIIFKKIIKINMYKKIIFF